MFKKCACEAIDIYDKYKNIDDNSHDLDEYNKDYLDIDYQEKYGELNTTKKNYILTYCGTYDSKLFDECKHDSYIPCNMALGKWEIEKIYWNDAQILMHRLIHNSYYDIDVSEDDFYNADTGEMYYSCNHISLLPVDKYNDVKTIKYLTEKKNYKLHNDTVLLNNDIISIAHPKSEFRLDIIKHKKNIIYIAINIHNFNPYLLTKPISLKEFEIIKFFKHNNNFIKYIDSFDVYTRYYIMYDPFTNYCLFDFCKQKQNQNYCILLRGIVIGKWHCIAVKQYNSYTYYVLFNDNLNCDDITHFIKTEIHATKNYICLCPDIVRQSDKTYTKNTVAVPDKIISIGNMVSFRICKKYEIKLVSSIGYTDGGINCIYIKPILDPIII
jgi:hypothetical protein